MTATNDIRSAFLAYFAGHEHKVVASSPLVPINDPTLMFANAGMVQFKNVFTGQESRSYDRAVTAQKCVRAGGKHNDLDNVGHTARHHTFFEMLGNFSFGDYFKEKAVYYAWDLLTNDFAIDPTRLWVTVFHEDDEAFDLWHKISGLPEDRIVRIATSDNFWAMGPTGPCGPCSEIFYDHGEDHDGGPPGSSEEDGDRFVEIWNLVFMQFDQVSKDERHSLPKPCVDTGMGLERIAAVLQGTHDNYETDTFRRLIEASREAIGDYGEGTHLVEHRVIADHLRAAGFLIADGVLPSNEGRGYVLRRIMRRAMRQIHLLGSKDLVMHRLVPPLVSEMGQAYPDLGRAQALIEETLELEEESFRKTLERGLNLLEKAVAKLSEKEPLPGDVAFQLYDTYGFPIDLTEDAMRAEGRSIEMAGFEAAMEKQRAEARKHWSGSGDEATEKIWFEIRQASGATDFLGYETEAAEAQVLAIVSGGKQVSEAKTGQELSLVTNQTPFYGESGGQIGDAGLLTGPDGARFVVADTQKKLGDLHIHVGRMEEGALAVGDFVKLEVDGNWRRKLRANHSATHLMHAALKAQLGDKVTQKGSYVGPDRLRFDLAQRQVITPEELVQIEDDVNAQIALNLEVRTHLMTPDAAIAEGAEALFGEKYGEEVRVVSMGGEDHGGRANYSVELCGGTHVKRTGDIGLFKIVAQSAVSAGVRRLEALTSDAARHYLLGEEARLKETAGILKAAPKDVPDRVRSLMDERRRLEDELREAKRKLAIGGDSGTGPEVKDIGGVKFLGQILENIEPKELRRLADAAKKTLDSGVVALISVTEGKAALLVGLTDDLTGTFDAVELVQTGAGVVGGKGGGGRKDMAQAGGPGGAAAEDALAAIEAAVAKTASGDS
jgi:alanyl-tRNA synthetase